MQVVETQSAGSGLPRVLLLTFFVLMRALEICGDAHSRAFQSFVTMNFVTIAQVSILSCCTGLLVLLEHCSWLMLVSVSAEMALHLTDGC